MRNDEFPCMFKLTFLVTIQDCSRKLWQGDPGASALGGWREWETKARKGGWPGMAKWRPHAGKAQLGRQMPRGHGRQRQAPSKPAMKVMGWSSVLLHK